MDRIRRVESKDEKNRLVDEFYTRGYKIKENGEVNARLKKKEYGDADDHIVIFILLLILATVIFNIAGLPPIGIWVVVIGGNIIYAIYCWYTAEEVLITLNNSE